MSIFAQSAPSDHRTSSAGTRRTAARPASRVRRQWLAARIRQLGLTSLGALAVVGLGSPTTAGAQEACCFEPAYRLRCDTVLEPRVETAYRQRMTTVPETREVKETRYVLKTRTEEREYTVARPVVKTATREETYTVVTPVWETSYEEQQRTRTRMTTETSERVQHVTSYRPVTETQYQAKQYQVYRPVTETAYQTQSYTAMRPVTTMQSRVVDAGGYVPQQVVTPGSVGYGLQWVPRAYQTTGPLGIFSVNRGGLFWTPQATPPTVQTQWAYRPNLVTQEFAQTQYVPETVQQQVPVQRTRYQAETVTEQVPVQVTRMEPITEERRIPVTVQRPVTETFTEKVPVRRMKYVTETKTRQVPVRTTETVYEKRVEPVEVQYYEPQEVTREVTVYKQVPVVETYQRTVYVRRPRIQVVAPSYSDPFAPSLGYSSSMPPIVYGDPIEVGSSVLEESEPESAAKPGVTGMESKTTEEGGEPSPSDQEEAQQSPDNEGNDANSGGEEADGASDSDPVDAPSLDGPKNRPVMFRMPANRWNKPAKQA